MFCFYLDYSFIAASNRFRHNFFDECYLTPKLSKNGHEYASISKIINFISIQITGTRILFLHLMKNASYLPKNCYGRKKENVA